jgi:hypothetical protein
MYCEMDGMQMSSQTGPEPQAQQPDEHGRRLWWLRLLAGPLIYGVYFALAYLAVEAACRTGWLRFTVADTNGITVTVLALTAAAAAAVLISLVASALRWRRLRVDAHGEAADADRFVAQVGMLLDALFLLLILATGAPVVLLAPCAWS